MRSIKNDPEPSFLENNNPQHETITKKKAPVGIWKLAAQRSSPQLVCTQDAIDAKLVITQSDPKNVLTMLHKFYLSLPRNLQSFILMSDYRHSSNAEARARLWDTLINAQHKKISINNSFHI